MLQRVPTMLTNNYSCNTCSSKLNNLDMGNYIIIINCIIFIIISVIADTSIIV